MSSRTRTRARASRRGGTPSSGVRAAEGSGPTMLSDAQAFQLLRSQEDTFRKQHRARERDPRLRVRSQSFAMQSQDPLPQPLASPGPETLAIRRVMTHGGRPGAATLVAAERDSNPSPPAAMLPAAPRVFVMPRVVAPAQEEEEEVRLTEEQRMKAAAISRAAVDAATQRRVMKEQLGLTDEEIAAFAADTGAALFAAEGGPDALALPPAVRLAWQGGLASPSSAAGVMPMAASPASIALSPSFASLPARAASFAQEEARRGTASKTQLPPIRPVDAGKGGARRRSRRRALEGDGLPRTSSPLAPHTPTHLMARTAPLPPRAPLSPPSWARTAVPPLSPVRLASMRADAAAAAAAARGCAHPHSDARALRAELTDAVRNVQALTTLVQRDLAKVREVCPVSRLRAREFLHRFGVRRFQAVMGRLQHLRTHGAFRKWVEVVAYEQLQEKRRKFMRMSGTAALLNAGRRQERQHMSRAFAMWWRAAVIMRDAERWAREWAAAINVQRVVRGWLARRRVAVLRAERQRWRRHEAALRIQTQFRARVARKYVRLLATHMMHVSRAIVIQRAFRTRRQRRICRAILDAKRQLRDARLARERRAAEEQRAATRLQALARGRLARKRVDALLARRELDEAATVIQTAYRVRLARQELVRRREARRMGDAAMAIQRRMRGILGRRRFRRVRHETTLQERSEQAAATAIQRVARGWLARRRVAVLAEQRRQRRAEEAAAALVLQRMWRGRQVRVQLARHKRSHRAYVLSLSRQWVECKDEATGAPYFVNPALQESLWEAPASGYVRLDGKLVLASGRVEPDPRETLAAYEGVRLVCVNCETREARRRCQQCSDDLCERCYVQLHSAGARLTHSWVSVAPYRCVECDVKLGRRWCAQCDDAYCHPCFAVMHSKGKKAAHAWVPIPDFAPEAGLAEAAAAVDASVAAAVAAAAYAPSRHRRPASQLGATVPDEAYQQQTYEAGDPAAVLAEEADYVADLEDAAAAAAAAATTTTDQYGAWGAGGEWEGQPQQQWDAAAQYQWDATQPQQQWDASAAQQWDATTQQWASAQYYSGAEGQYTEGQYEQWPQQ